MTDMPEYLLGTNPTELERLEFQHSVWRETAEAALDRAGVGEGMTVLDLGCGPGFVTRELARRVGPTGRVVALDESPVWHEVLGQTDFDAPVERVQSRIEDADLGEARFDAVFCRWVFSFLSDLDDVCMRVARALKPGGVLVAQDYNHEGVSIFPPSEGFAAAVRATREFYEGAGGDSWVMGRLPAAAAAAGLGPVELNPVVKVGGPGSGVFRWADVFFPVFAQRYVEHGLMTDVEYSQFLSEWAARKANPDTLFYSPMVVDLIARRG